MAAASLSAFSSLSLRHSSHRFSLPTTTTSFSTTTTTTSLFFPLSLSTTKFNCTQNADEFFPPIRNPESQITQFDSEYENEELVEDDPAAAAAYRETMVDLDPDTSTEEEIAAAYEELYGTAFSGVKMLNKFNDMEGGGISEPVERIRDGFEEQVVQVRRVTKVVKGGKKMNFRAIVVVGNKRGKVGVGHGKAAEIGDAVQKGAKDARRNLIDVPLTKYMTFPHRANGKYGAAEVMLRPACPGTGVIAGGAVRIVLELAGLENALGKQLRSNNMLNNARATIYAILKMKSFSEVAAYRGLTIEEMW